MDVLPLAAIVPQDGTRSAAGPKQQEDANTPQKTGVRASIGKQNIDRGPRKRASLSERRAIVAELVARDGSERLACRLVDLSRSTSLYKPQRDDRNQRLRDDIFKLAQQSWGHG